MQCGGHSISTYRAGFEPIMDLILDVYYKEHPNRAGPPAQHSDGSTENFMKSKLYPPGPLTLWIFS